MIAGAQLNDLMLTIAVLAVGALGWGGARTWVRGDRTRGLLMIACAAVVLMNVLIWTI